MKETNKYYVYEWIRLDTNEPFYVGKGHGNRWRTLTRGKNSHFNHIVATIPVAVVLLEKNLDEQTAFEYEIYYINEYKNMGLPLVNILDGGDNPPIVHLSGKRNGMYGKKGKLASFYGKKHSEETRQLMREAKKDFTPWNKGQHTGNGNKDKKVICLTTREVFNSGKIAENKYNLTRSSISNCCLGRKYGGRINNLPLIWLWYDDYLKMSKEEIKNKIYNGFKDVIYCTTTGEIFFNVKEASNKYNTGYHAISNCVHGKSKTSGQLKDGTRLEWCKYNEYIKENQQLTYNENLVQAI